MNKLLDAMLSRTAAFDKRDLKPYLKHLHLIF